MARDSGGENLSEMEFQKKVLEYRALQERAAALQSQLSAVRSLLEEAANASKTVSALSSAAGSPVLFPVGSGVIARAGSVDSKKLLVEAGSGAVLEKTPEEASKMVGEKISRLSKALLAYESELRQVSDRLEQLSRELSAGRTG